MTHAFEQMRVNLQARLQESEPSTGRQPGSCLQPDPGRCAASCAGCGHCDGASSAAIVLVRDIFPSAASTPVRFADGPERDVYRHLDHQFLSLVEKQERLVMATVSRNRGLILDPNLPQPESLIAIALRNERRYHGVLWAAYNKQHIFTEAELQYISTLASQAALAVTNIRSLSDRGSKPPPAGGDPQFHPGSRVWSRMRRTG